MAAGTSDAADEEDCATWPVVGDDAGPPHYALSEPCEPTAPNGRMGGGTLSPGARWLHGEAEQLNKPHGSRESRGEPLGSGDSRGAAEAPAQDKMEVPLAASLVGSEMSRGAAHCTAALPLGSRGSAGSEGQPCEASAWAELSEDVLQETLGLLNDLRSAGCTDTEDLRRTVDLQAETHGVDASLLATKALS